MGTRSLICVVHARKFVIAQYSQWDGYFENQGKTIYEFLSTPANIERLESGLSNTHPCTTTQSNKIHLEVARLVQFKEDVLSSSTNFELFKKGKYTSPKEAGEKSKMSKAEIERFEDWKGTVLADIPEGKCYEVASAVMEAKSAFPDKKPLNIYWPSLSRDTGAGILEVVASSSPKHGIPIELELEYFGMYCEYGYVVDLDEKKFEVFAGVTSKANSVSSRFDDVEEYGSITEPDLVPRFVMSFDFHDLPATAKEFVEICYDSMERAGRRVRVIGKKR